MNKTILTLIVMSLLSLFNLATAKTVAEIKEDYIRHLPEIQRAAEEGNPNAQAILGTMYKRGWGVERNDSLAYEWLEKSAKQGNKMAQNNLAGLYTRDNTQNNDEKALQLLKLQGFSSGGAYGARIEPEAGTVEMKGGFHAV